MRRGIRLGLVALVVAASASTGVSAPAIADRPQPVTPRAAVAGDAWSQTKSMQRELIAADGTSTAISDPNTGGAWQVTVSADHTQNLRGRERVGITWSGAQPSAGRANDPFGPGGMNQEYPVVVLQCRGTGDDVKPETCWTSSFGQRSQVSRSPSDATWTEDLHALGSAKTQVSSALGDVPGADRCPDVDRSGVTYTRLVPFVSAKGQVYPACDAKTMPPEAASEAALPANEIAGYTDAQGRGSAQFEVRTDVENESLGCSKQVACSIVVIPIGGISCESASTEVEQQMTPVEKSCRRTGQFSPGSSNFTSTGVDQAVSPALWWAESNWRNRFAIPVTFGDPPDTCDILDPRAPTGFYGSELLAQAALQWAPAYCLNKKRFKFQHNQMPDQAGFSLMASGGGAAALVSSKYESEGDPVGYAPVALTGFGIGYIVDRPENAGEYTDLRLNARLLAKLVTQSYVGSSYGAAHPGMEQNPWAITKDPEFTALNPGLTDNALEAGATLLSLSNSSDVIRQLTEYIAADKEAMAFVKGKADPWGMRVNPSYKKIKLPRDEWPLLDDFVPQGGTDCKANNPSTYFNDLAAPVSTMRKVAEALLDAWPNVQTRCDTDLSVTPPIYKVGRVERQHYGDRFMLGVVSLGDAQRYGLRTAGLETRKDKYVTPTTDSLTAAMKVIEPDGKRGPFEMDMVELRKAGNAYPGTMLVYTAARLQNLDKKDAAKVAQFIRTATTEGQRSGSGNGQLPGGFVPIRKSGATKALYTRAQAVARAIEQQKVPVAPPEAGPATVTPGSPEAVPVGEPVVAAPAAGPAAAPEALTMPPTKAVSSEWSGRLLPVLLMLGLVFAVVSAVSRVVTLRSRR
ncbi:hypothetical protein KVF89_05235 [Nocardioides carbamazepini]|uniref:hypothetical protein n=1 Tax=Nocardioides carbamazepini TaxID=2854259 RepID=UPI00214A25A2|nr:hypothetical protein [Nocardioides carbamazepini]MCR1781931.1 hypothetical protein [Nocardioides carbamazepini]